METAMSPKEGDRKDSAASVGAYAVEKMIKVAAWKLDVSALQSQFPGLLVAAATFPAPAILPDDGESRYYAVKQFQFLLHQVLMISQCPYISSLGCFGGGSTEKIV